MHQAVQDVLACRGRAPAPRARRGAGWRASPSRDLERQADGGQLLGRQQHQSMMLKPCAWKRAWRRRWRGSRGSSLPRRCHSRWCGRPGSDRRMAGRGEGAHDGHLVLGGRVGRVDDAERRLADRDQGQRHTHVLGLGELVRHALPYAKAFQGGLAVLAGGDRLTSAMASRPPFSAPARSKPGRSRSGRRRCRRRSGRSSLPRRLRRVAGSMRTRPSR